MSPYLGGLVEGEVGEVHEDLVRVGGGGQPVALRAEPRHPLPRNEHGQPKSDHRQLPGHPPQFQPDSRVEALDDAVDAEVKLEMVLQFQAMKDGVREVGRYLK